MRIIIITFEEAYDENIATYEYQEKTNPCDFVSELHMLKIYKLSCIYLYLINSISLNFSTYETKIIYNLPTIFKPRADNSFYCSHADFDNSNVVNIRIMVRPNGQLNLYNSSGIAIQNIFPLSRSITYITT